MSVSWVSKMIEPLLIGAIGGMSAYLLAQRRYIRERTWEKRYELYGTIFIKNQIGHSLLILEYAVSADRLYRQGAESRAAAIAYNSDLTRLNQLQERLMLLGCNEAHVRLMVVYAGLRVFYPQMVIEPEELEGNEIKEIADLIKSCV